jgi:hypothetical protein
VLEDPAAGQQAGGPAGEARAAPPTGAVTVPPWQEGAEASVLPQSYQDLLEMAASAGRGAASTELSSVEAAELHLPAGDTGSVTGWCLGAGMRR